MLHRRALSTPVVLIAIVFSAWTAMAQTPQPPFQPPTPPQDKFDWIQLTSGEWLKGELIALYDDVLEFDSDKLDKLTLDWEDVRQVRTGRVVQVGVQNREPLIGRLVVDGNSIQVQGDTTQQVDRADLISIAPGEPKERSYWSGNTTIGFNLRKGNSEQVEANTLASIRRRTLSTRCPSCPRLGNRRRRRGARCRPRSPRSASCGPVRARRNRRAPVRRAAARRPCAC